MTLRNFKGLSQDGAQLELAKKHCAFNKPYLNYTTSTQIHLRVQYLLTKKAEKHLQIHLGEDQDPDMYHKLRMRNTCYTYGTRSVLIMVFNFYSVFRE